MPGSSGGAYTTIPLDFSPTGINDNNIVVSATGTLWSARTGDVNVNSLLPPNSGWVLTSVAGINNDNDLTGSGSQGAYLLTGVNLGDLPNIAATAPSFNPSGGGVNFGYTITGADLPQATTVDLDWASGTTVDTVIGDPIVSTTTETARGTYDLQVTPAQLGTPPQGANDLLVVADPDNSVSAADPSKVMALPLPAVMVQSIQWHPSTQDQWNAPDGDSPESGSNAGGVDILYTVSGANLPGAVPIALYWTDESGRTISGAITRGDDGNRLMSETAVNLSDEVYTIHVPASQLLVPPTGAAMLLVTVNPPDSAKYVALVAVDNEPNQSNTIAANAESILSPYQLNGTTIRAVTASIKSDDSAEIDATFRPAGGALSLAQAAALLRVNHFNWVQTIVLKPENWTIYMSPSGQVVAQSGLGQGEDVITTQLYDPDNHPGSVRMFDEGHGVAYPNPTPGVPDIWPFYFSEPLTSDPDPIDAIEDDSTLNFYDSPEFYSFGPNQYVGFDTQLVGVNQVGASFVSVPLGGTDTEFMWRTNATESDGGIVGYDYTRTFGIEGSLPAVASGAVSDVLYATPPNFAPIANAMVVQGGTLSFTASATDANTGTTLTYTLDPGSPSGATIDPATGAFSWTVPASETPGDYTLTIIVTDNGDPPLSNMTSVAIDVISSQQRTGLSDVSASGTYGGTATLTATLTSIGTPLAGKTILFTLNEGNSITPVGMATTDASGIATLPGVSLDSFNAGTYSGAVGASFASEATLGSSSTSGNLTVNPAKATLTLSGLTFTYDGTPHRAAVGTDPGGLAGVAVTYSQNGVVVAAPTNPGVYTVTAVLNNPNFAAVSVTGTLVVSPPAPSIIREQPVFRRRPTRKASRPANRRCRGSNLTSALRSTRRVRRTRRIIKSISSPPSGSRRSSITSCIQSRSSRSPTAQRTIPSH